MMGRKAGTIILYALAGVGTLAIILASLGGAMHWLLYETTTEQSVPAPRSELKATREVTRGGLGTVWTTAVFVESASGDKRLVYRNKDSDYVPIVRWLGPESLQIVVHCGRVDHMASPSGYVEGGSPIERFRVGFVYDKSRCAHPRGDQ